MEVTVIFILAFVGVTVFLYMFFGMIGVVWECIEDAVHPPRRGMSPDPIQKYRQRRYPRRLALPSAGDAGVSADHLDSNHCTPPPYHAYVLSRASAQSDKMTWI